MWIKNTITNLIWKIEDEKQIKNLLSSDHFEEVEAPSKKKDTSNKKSNSKQTETMKCEVCGKECEGQRSYTQHRRMAHGIDKDGNPVDTKKYNAKYNNNLANEKDGEE